MDSSDLSDYMREIGRRGARARWAKATAIEKTVAGRHAARARWKNHLAKLRRKRQRPAD